MPIWSRRRIETIGLAVLAIAAVIPIRIFVESRFWFLAEMGSLCFAVLATVIVKGLGSRWSGAKMTANLTTVTLGFIPIAFAIVARAFGSPIALEISALATFGAVALAMAVGATTNRTRSLSLVISGFLVLFCASISEHQYAVVLPLAWMLGCMWHLIANHWERLDLAMPDSVQRTWSLRPTSLVVALIASVAAGYAVKDRISSSRLAWGWMPTSGGSVWSDPAALRGVGTGDAAIAAKDQAESFAAVDSDIFLESTESSLFDMVNDMIGEAKQKKNQWERAQAMGNENVIPSHQQAAKSERGGGSFSTERLPPKKHHHFNDTFDVSVVQWDGPTGIRLAMHRYDTFDGRDWTQSADLKNDKLTRVDIDKAAWFFHPNMRNVLLRGPAATSVGRLKIIRLDSQRLPVPMMTAGVHIKDVDRQDFFGISEDDSFFMPGRKKVPPLTVVHVASVNLMEDQIREKLVVDLAKAQCITMDKSLAQSTTRAMDQLVRSACLEHTSPLDQLESCIEKLRTEFTFSRDGQASATSLTEFLDSRTGGDHLFATTAALMSRRIGLSSRLVTGFYVRPNAFDIAAGHASVLPQDVHVWAEVQLDDGVWFEIEPTPGYQQPHFRPSWRLLVGRFVAAYWPSMVGGMLAVAGVYLSRCIWIDWGLAVVWTLAGWLRPRNRIRLAIGIIETRARLAGYRRPLGKSQRAWLEQLTLNDAHISEAARRFSDAADALFFGHGKEPTSRDATALVRLLRIDTITALTKEATS